MIEKLQIKGFKSIENLEFEPGRVNVLIGANGSGKSNLLEAIGVLSAAVAGRVDDEMLLRRGVRPGVPALYKSSFRDLPTPRHISFGAWSGSASYEVSLFNPIKDPSSAWRYKIETLKEHSETRFWRSTATSHIYNPEAGLIALKLFEMAEEDVSFQLLVGLRDFVVYCPNTPTLRGNTPDPHQRQPVGLSGGQLANAVSEIIKERIRTSPRIDEFDAFLQKITHDTRSMIDWAESHGAASASSMPLSPSVGTTERVIRFTDRFMKSGRNVISGYDASEGALYILFQAVLAAHPKSPQICAVDNADHGLNPRLARALFTNICDWYLNSPYSRQIFLTTQNPLSLDGLPLQDDRVRLFSVSRTDKGRTVVKRIVLDEQLAKMGKEGWTISRLWVMGHLGGVPNV